MAGDQLIEIHNGPEIGDVREEPQQNSINDSRVKFFILSVFGIYKPIQLVNSRIGYNCKTKRGKREWLCSVLLSCILIMIAILLSSIFIPIHFDPQFCIMKEDSLVRAKEFIRNNSNIDALTYNFTKFNETISFYYDQAALFRSNWPRPYQMNETERQHLESLANRQCSEEVCKYDGWIFGLDCVDINIPCPDLDATRRIRTYDDYRRSMNFTINTNIDDSYRYNFMIDASISEILQLLLDRIRVASSLYICYRAIMIYFSSRNLVGKSFSAYMCNFNINKLIWIITVVILLYIIDFIINGVGIVRHLKVIWYEPCWIDMEYTNSIFDYMNEIGQNITFMRYSFQFNHIIFQQYQIIDKSYLADVYPSNVLRYPDTPPSYLFTTNFSSADAFDNLIDRSDDDKAGLNINNNIFKFSIFIILLQPILCEFIMSLWNTVLPLSIYCGRIIAPDNKNQNISVKKILISERIHSIIISILMAVILLWISYILLF